MFVLQILYNNFEKKISVMLHVRVSVKDSQQLCTVTSSRSSTILTSKSFKPDEEMQLHSFSPFPFYSGQEFTGNYFPLTFCPFPKWCLPLLHTAHTDCEQRSVHIRHTEGNTSRLCSFPARSPLRPRSVCLSHNLRKGVFTTENTSALPKKLFPLRFGQLQVDHIVFTWCGF